MLDTGHCWQKYISSLSRWWCLMAASIVIEQDWTGGWDNPHKAGRDCFSWRLFLMLHPMVGWPRLPDACSAALSMFLLNRTGRGNMTEKLVDQDKNGDITYLLPSWAKQKINVLLIRIAWIVRNKIKSPSVLIIPLLKCQKSPTVSNIFPSKLNQREKSHFFRTQISKGLKIIEVQGEKKRKNWDLAKRWFPK